MLTSGSHHYIQPEYLSPLPTTLDAKKSPLALLAQTCSQIGADNSNNKPISSGLEKPKNSDKTREKMSFVEDKNFFKPYESSSKKNNSGSAEKRSTVTPITSESPKSNTTNNDYSKTSMCVSEERSPNSEQGATPSSSKSTPTPTSSTYAISQNTLSSLGYFSSGSLHSLDTECSESSSKELLGSFPDSNPFSVYKPGANPLGNCVGCTPMFGHIPVDIASSAHNFPTSVTTKSVVSPMKQNMLPVGGGMSQYVGYTCVKTPGGGTSFVPFCRDPSCVNCQFTLASAQPNQCANGCSQCNPDRLPGMGLAGLVPGLSGSSSPTAITGLHPHSVIHRPNVCSWMIGNSFCGKRFSSSEELLRHLRNHTSFSVVDSASSLSYFPANLNGPCHIHYGSPTTPTNVRLSYPSSLSPLSNRFHPYKSSLPTLPGVPLSQVPYSGLGLYCPPYSFYGQRVGPPVQP
ncbi:zinc finger protein Noc-like [Limulus polyphemus]|uniref:Zinc finger protein Noc-like n=1 Tax=Limulus polyphemus TaxID=6850 RepID=A0ABM1BW50_LIMPO|nr:zinc finger protein Noc-like [Limulus polyphemus]